MLLIPIPLEHLLQAQKSVFTDEKTHSHGEKRAIECKASNLPGFLFIRRAKLHRRFVLMRNWEEWGWGGALKCHNLFVFPCRGCVSFYPILPFIMKCRRFSLYFPYFEYKSWCNLG